MRIVLTIHHELDRNSGSPGTTIALAEAYARAGHETEILSFDDLPARLGPQARMIAFPLLVAGRLAGRLGRWCEVVDASSGDAWLWSLGRRGSRLPLLVTRSHGLEHREHLERLVDYRNGRIALRRRYFAYHGGVRLREVAGSLRRADLSFYLNHDDLEFSVAALGVDRGRAHLVHNGIDDSLLGLPAPVESVGERVRIALIARHTEGMGAAYYVPGLTRVLGSHPTVRLTLLGSGAPAEEVLRDFASGLRERISVVPSYQRRELPSLLAGHELLVSAKFSEGFGKALVEGMACGLAPVAGAGARAATTMERANSDATTPRRPSSAALIVPPPEILATTPALAGARRGATVLGRRPRNGATAEAIAERSAARSQRPRRAARGAPRLTAARRPLPDRLVAPDVEREQVA